MKNLKILYSGFILSVMFAVFNTVKAMIVVQGAIQLWPVTIINNSGMTLVVVDEIIDPYGSSFIGRTIPSIAPNNQFTFQWPSTFDKPNARKITIHGKRYAVISTNKIKIGNTTDSNYPCVPSGTFTIIKQSMLEICVADKLNPEQSGGR